MPAPVEPRRPNALLRAIRALGRGYRDGIVAARWVVVLGWVAGTVLLAVVLRPPHVDGGSGIGNLLPSDSAAAAAAERSLHEFRIPVQSQTSVVLHDPDGLSRRARAEIARRAQAENTRHGPPPNRPGHIVAAIPVPTATPTVAVTYLITSKGTSAWRAHQLAQRYAAHFRDLRSVRAYVTGLAPAEVRQAAYAGARLRIFELGTLALIAVVVGLVFRSLVAPLVVLTAAGIGFLGTVRCLDLIAASFGYALPSQFEPILAALLLGVITDYCVLLFSGLRHELDRGLPRLAAARRALTVKGPIVAVAALTVAGGTGALLAARFALFRAMGPALALTVLVGAVVCLTLVPALLAILGRRLFAPSSPRPRLRPPAERCPGWLLRRMLGRRGAAVALTLGVGLLAVAAVPMGHLRLGLSFTSVLPAADPVRQGALVLRDSGIRGVVAPTEVLLEGHDVALRRQALARLQAAVAGQPGVARVLGPGQLPDRPGLVLSPDGDAARLLVVLDSDPLSAPAIADLHRLTGRLDRLAVQAGLHGAHVSVTGQTAIAAELAALTRDNLRITLVVALLVELVILVLFLRALVAPVVLLACSALGVAASLGLTVLLFQDVRGDPDLTFYAPFAAAVLLLALGSDYNVFAIGSIWDAAARLPLRQAIARSMPQTTRAIGSAGLILAASFATVAVIPLESVREIAFAMAAGLLIDTFLVRPVITPAVLVLLGRAASWPGRRVRTADPSAPTAAPARRPATTVPLAIRIDAAWQISTDERHIAAVYDGE